MNKRVPEVGTPNTRQYNTIQCNNKNNSIEYSIKEYNSNPSPYSSMVYKDS